MLGRNCPMFYPQPAAHMVSWANGLIDGQVRAVNASGHLMSMVQLAQKDARPWARESWRGREKNMTISTCVKTACFSLGPCFLSCGIRH